MRDQSLGSTFVIDFTTHSLTTDELIAPSAAFTESDFRIYKVSSSNEKTSNNGITIDSPFDTLVGNHRLSIDTSNSTGDAGFWVSGEAYNVVIVTAKTVDGKSISGRIVASFSIERQTADVRKIGGDGQSATDLKDFADAGYDPSTNKVHGVVLVDTLTTYTDNTPQTGDTYALASGAAGFVAIDTVVDLILVDTANVKSRLPAALQSGRMDSYLGAAANNVITNNVLATNAIGNAQLATSAINAIQSGLAVSATALSTAVWTNTLATNLGTTNTNVTANLDTTISSRLASASYTAPPSAATISIQVASDLAIAHGAGSWATATGFAVPGDEMTLTSAYDAAKTAATQTSVDDLPTNTELATALGTADDAVLAAIAAEAVKTAAIKVTTDRISTGLVADGQVWQFTANMLELAPAGGGGGGGSVTVLPAVGISADRSPGITLNAFVGETITQSITLYETDGTTPIVLTGKTLAIVFETRQGLDVAVVVNANITVSGASDNVVTFAYPSASTSAQRVLKFALRDASAPKTVYIQGLLNVTRAPSVDA